MPNWFSGVNVKAEAAPVKRLRWQWLEGQPQHIEIYYDNNCRWSPLSAYMWNHASLSIIQLILRTEIYNLINFSSATESNFLYESSTWIHGLDLRPQTEQICWHLDELPTIQTTQHQLKLKTKWGQVRASPSSHNATDGTAWLGQPTRLHGVGPQNSTGVARRRVWIGFRNKRPQRNPRHCYFRHGRSMVVKFRQRASDVTPRIVRSPWPTNARPICHTGWKLCGLDGRPYPYFKTFSQTMLAFANWLIGRELFAGEPCIMSPKSIPLIDCSTDQMQDMVIKFNR